MADDLARQSREQAHTVALPDGWQVVSDPLVGVSMLDASRRIIGQHPWDSAAWRRGVLYDYFRARASRGDALL